MTLLVRGVGPQPPGWAVLDREQAKFLTTSRLVDDGRLRPRGEVTLPAPPSRSSVVEFGLDQCLLDSDGCPPSGAGLGALVCSPLCVYFPVRTSVCTIRHVNAEELPSE